MSVGHDNSIRDVCRTCHRPEGLNRGVGPGRDVEPDRCPATVIEVCQRPDGAVSDLTKVCRTRQRSVRSGRGLAEACQSWRRSVRPGGDLSDLAEACQTWRRPVRPGRGLSDLAEVCQTWQRSFRPVTGLSDLTDVCQTW